MVDVVSSVYYGHYDKLKAVTQYTQAIYCHEVKKVLHSRSPITSTYCSNEVRGLNFHVEGLKLRWGLTTEVEGLSPPAPPSL